MRQQARRLVAEGKFAFFVAREDLDRRFVELLVRQLVESPFKVDEIRHPGAARGFEAARREFRRAAVTVLHAT